MTKLPAGTPTQILDQVLDFGRYIAEKTEGFAGRQWIFDKIDGFVRKERRGYVLLYGDPGIGKSALMAELVRRRGYPHHFNVRADSINSADIFLNNICAQLIAAHALGHTYLPPEATRDSSFLSALLEEAAAKLRPEGQKLVILVDALDEADRTQAAGANILYLPASLPEDVYVVTTSRHVPGLLRVDCEQMTFEMRQDDSANVTDIRILVEGSLERPGIRRYLAGQDLSEMVFVDEMTDKSQGNLMYLHHVLSTIEAGAYKDREFASLPNGLLSYYEDHWKLIRRQDEVAWFGYKLPVLVALTIVREPVSVEMLQEFSGVNQRELVCDVLREWSQFLYSTGNKKDDGRWQQQYRIYHASFQDFIADKDEVEDGHFPSLEASCTSESSSLIVTPNLKR